VNHIASGTATVRRPWRPGKGQADAFALLGHLRPAGELATFHRVTYLQIDGFSAHRRFDGHLVDDPAGEPVGFQTST
jgi:hypothetical protein